MSPPESPEFRARLDAAVGGPVAGSGHSTAPDPVNQPMIRHWTAAFEDINPVYVDADVASRSRFGQIVAPPLMLQTWTMPTPDLTGIAERGGAPAVPHPQVQAREPRMSRPQVGDALPVLEIEMTATRIVAGAIATRDFMPVHHDRDYANAQGAPDIFMNVLSTTAYCGRYLTDWAGHEALVARLSIRLGVPVFPGSTLTFTGTVTALTEECTQAIAEVEFRATTDLGEHAWGTASVSLPA